MKFEIQYGQDNPVLRAKCDPVARHELAKFGKLGKQMIKYIKDPKNGGIWLAAPQIGIKKRVICCGLPIEWDQEWYPIVYMINPQILEQWPQTDVVREGCLSLPETFGDVERSTSIVVEYFDEKGKKYKRKVNGFGARVIQHEIDHLNGVLFTDKLVDGKTYSTPN